MSPSLAGFVAAFVVELTSLAVLRSILGSDPLVAHPYLDWAGFGILIGVLVLSAVAALLASYRLFRRFNVASLIGATLLLLFALWVLSYLAFLMACADIPFFGASCH